VVVAARDAQALEALAHEIRSTGGEALAVPTDIGDTAAAERLVDETMSAFGRLDAAFNNATDGPMPALLTDTRVVGLAPVKPQ
jgi:NADP-dependent 3-hydroxy acid dehydrogenase YdfG